MLSIQVGNTCWLYMLIIQVGYTCWLYMLIIHVDGEWFDMLGLYLL